MPMGAKHISSNQRFCTLRNGVAQVGCSLIVALLRSDANDTPMTTKASGQGRGCATPRGRAGELLLEGRNVFGGIARIGRYHAHIHLGVTTHERPT